MLPETQRYRRADLAVRARLLRDLQRVWPALRMSDLDGSFPQWAALAAVVVGRSRAEAVATAGEYLTALDCPVVPPPPLPPAQFVASMRVTALVAVKVAVRNGMALDAAARSAFVQHTGAASRLVMDGGRLTVMGSTVASPDFAGWRRVTAGGCDFCRMLAGRGGVYRESTAGFRSHDHCACSAEPARR